MRSSSGGIDSSPGSLPYVPPCGSIPKDVNVYANPHVVELHEAFCIVLGGHVRVTVEIRFTFIRFEQQRRAGRRTAVAENLDVVRIAAIGRVDRPPGGT